MLFYGVDMYYLIWMIPVLIFTFWAQSNVDKTYKKYSNVPSDRGMTGAQAARMILDSHGLTDVAVKYVKGTLNDHYDPRSNTIRLSDSTYNVASASAVGVAAHECGHAIQYSEGYFPIKIRSAIIPVTSIGTTMAVPLVILGMLLSFPSVSYIGVVLFAAAVVFQLVTLPVEFDASRRAIAELDQQGISDEGRKAAGKVLRAAAMTYVAALAMALLQFLRILAIASRSKRN